jgi:hypothetical protein
MVALLRVLHGDARTYEQLERDLDDALGDHPYVDMSVETSGGRTQLGRALDDLQQLGFTLTRRMLATDRADVQQLGLTGTVELDAELSNDDVAALDACRGRAEMLLSGSIGWWLRLTEPADQGSWSAIRMVGDAIRARQVIEFTFGGQRREVHPYLVCMGPRGRWFVGGWCRHGEGIRSFPIDAINNIDPLPQRSFRPPEPGDLDAAAETYPLRWGADETRVECSLEFSESAAPEVWTAFGLEPGTDPARVDTANTQHLLRLVCAHWPDVHLTGPDHLVAELLSALEHLAGEG